jgi:hypothetical protein
MLSDVNRAARITIEEPGTPTSPPQSTPRPSRLRSLLKRVWSLLVVTVSGPGLGVSGGIDDSAMPSGFMAPYRRGSRQVRNLWHLPF